MEIFESYIRKLREYVERKREEGKSVIEMRCPTEVKDIVQGLPVQFEDRSRSIILKEDTWVELGNPKTASSAFVLWTDDLGLVDDGLITLIGPDIGDVNEGYLPFGQIILVGGSGIKPKHYGKLRESQYVDDLKGYMIRAVPQRQRVWSRVSKETVEKGFSFETLGRVLMNNFKSKFPQVDAVEVVFVTSSSEDVKELGNIAEAVWGIWKEKTIKKGERRIIPMYNCDSCENKEICEEIWKMLALRRGISPLEKRPAILCAED